MDDIWKRDEVESPCVKLCVIDERHGHCLGCFRTRHEIAGWSRMNNEERQALKLKLPDREKALTPKRRGGRTSTRRES